jgi:hypothetical protein
MDFQPGCYIDEVRGRYAVAMLVRMAVEHGWQLEQQDFDDLDAYEVGEDPDTHYAVVPLFDDAEDYMNTLAPEGYTFAWHEGGFYLWPNEEWRILNP